MKAIAPLDFSRIIAFLLPGFVAFYALIYVSQRALQIITACLTKDAGAGAWLMLILFSLAAGIVVSALRTLVLDKVQFLTGIPKPSLDYSKLGNEHVLAAFNEAIDNTYRFAQFYGNMLISILSCLFIRAYYSGNMKAQWQIYAVLSITVVILYFAHRSELRQTHDKLGQILK